MTTNGDQPHRLPRLVVIKRGSAGFGFHLHCEKSRKGQFVRSVDEAGNAQRAGLLPGDRVVEVNGMNIDGFSHQDVVAEIRSGEVSTTLLVVDEEADKWYRQHSVAVTVQEAERKEISRDTRGAERHVTKGSPAVGRNVAVSSSIDDGPSPESSATVRMSMAAALPQGKKRKGVHQKGGWAARAAAFDQL